MPLPKYFEAAIREMVNKLDSKEQLAEAIVILGLPKPKNVLKVSKIDFESDSVASLLKHFGALHDKKSGVKELRILETKVKEHIIVVKENHRNSNGSTQLKYER